MIERAEKTSPRPATKPNRPSKQHLDALLDQALEQTFPASDPVALTAPRGEPASPREPNKTQG